MNPETGRFQTMDSFEGNPSDPLSLHKYLYAHASPVMGMDPSGNMDVALSQQQITYVIMGILMAVTYHHINNQQVMSAPDWAYLYIMTDQIDKLRFWYYQVGGEAGVAVVASAVITAPMWFARYQDNDYTRDAKEMARAGKMTVCAALALIKNNLIKEYNGKLPSVEKLLIRQAEKFLGCGGSQNKDRRGNNYRGK